MADSDEVLFLGRQLCDWDATHAEEKGSELDEDMQIMRVPNDDN